MTLKFFLSVVRQMSVACFVSKGHKKLRDVSLKDLRIADTGSRSHIIVNNQQIQNQTTEETIILIDVLTTIINLSYLKKPRYMRLE